MNPINREVDLIIKNADELLTLSSSFKDESGLGMIRNGAVIIKEGRISWVGKDRGSAKRVWLEQRGSGN